MIRMLRRYIPAGRGCVVIIVNVAAKFDDVNC